MSGNLAGLPASDKLLLRAAMFASAGAAAIHLGAAYPHLQEYGPAGAFMFIAGFAQLAWILAVLGDGPRGAVRAGVIGNVGILALWVVSRSVGLPFGPMRWTPEHIHSADALCGALESIVVVAGWMLLNPSRPRPARRLLVASIAGLTLTPLVHSHAQLREQTVAVAALLVASGIGSLFSVLSSIPTASSKEGEHVQASTHVWRGPVVYDAGARTTFGARV